MPRDLQRSLWLREWAAFFYGVGCLALSHQLAEWFGLRVIHPSWVMLGSGLLYLLCRNLSAAAQRRWREQNMLKVLDVIVQPRERESDGE